MRRALILAALALPGAALGQVPQPQTPQVQALQQTVLELMGAKLDWQTRAIEAQARIAELEKQAAAPKETKP